MNVYVIDHIEYLTLVQYEDEEGNIERKYIGREIDEKNIFIEVSQKNLDKAMDYSDVNLEDNLGPIYGNILAQQVEQAMRRAGLWMRADYHRNPHVVSRIAKRFNMDPTTVLNSAAYLKET